MREAEGTACSKPLANLVAHYMYSSRTNKMKYIEQREKREMANGDINKSFIMQGW